MKQHGKAIEKYKKKTDVIFLKRLLKVFSKET